MKEICRNCHFLAKEVREGTGRVLTSSVSTNERVAAKAGEIDFLKSYFGLKCQMGVWDEGVAPGKEDRLERVNITNRADKCFFFPYDPSMMFPAAEELQKRSQENRNLKKSNMYTRVGLWIAALALLINAAVNLFK
jgi:hypothetical protein